MPVLPATSLEATRLFLRLQELEDQHTSPPGLAGNVLTICQEASERLKFFPAVHSQYTLHDDRHCMRVVELMAMVSGSTLQLLNAIEIAALILCSYFHDQGMIVDAAELEEIRSSDEWKVHEQNWSVDHPNYEEATAKLSDPFLVTDERERTMATIGELRAAMFTDYVRNGHGDRSARYVQQHYGPDRRLILNGRSIVDLIATICVSHVRPPETITPASGYKFDELCGTTKVNVALLAYILRLADILDFDRERTPESLYRAIHFSSPISLLEWEKHRSITGWEIGPNRLVFSTECTHPAYERSVRDFLSWIDDELSHVHSWNQSLPAEFQRYRLELPQKVDRSRVGARVDPVTREPLYQYVDLELSLSRDEIIKLLMTDKLYSDTSLFIRELLQNGLDALRYRDALYRVDSVPIADLHVELHHYQDAGVDVVRCVDNGVGMDEAVITRFLTRVGRSYYRSPEFERERAHFKEKGCDFDPCARFGIGFMSCFMFGDDITIRTRRDFGLGRAHGRPLIVEIRGLSSILVIRPGTPDQAVGTTVEIRGRRKSFTVDEWSDEVNLINVLAGYALATEFPVAATCSVAAIKGELTIQPQMTARPHPLEMTTVGGKASFAVALATVDQRLRGEIRVCTLTDRSGVPSLSNDEAEVRVQGKLGQSRTRIVHLVSGTEVDLDAVHDTHQVCCDGILVAGKPGRGTRKLHLGSWGCNDGFGNASFLIDARGDLKPSLTPARTPPRDSFRHEWTWQRLFDVAGRGYSQILNTILERCDGCAPERFWEIAEAYELDLYRMNLLPAWRHLRFPIQDDRELIEWRRADDLGKPVVVFPSDDNESPRLTVDHGMQLTLPKMIDDLRGSHNNVSVHFFERLLMSMSTLKAVSPTELACVLREPSETASLSEMRSQSEFEWRWFFPCSGELAKAVSVAGRHGFGNSQHPVVIQARLLEHKMWGERSPLERIMGILMWGGFSQGFDSEVATGSWGARQRKRLGMLFRAVDWSSVPQLLHPPYNVFRPGKGMEAMTENHLDAWAED
jgi:hypothetical protein